LMPKVFRKVFGHLDRASFIHPARVPVMISSAHPDLLRIHTGDFRPEV
jgi:hypothetical protein